MKHSEPERVTARLLAELHRITPYDPAHQPREVALIEAFLRRHPGLPQVACFDTAFHRTVPRVASLAAVRDAKSIDTSMGFTPAAGLVVSTRTADLDPGLAYYLARTEQMTAAQSQRMVNRQSGLLGVSGTRSGVRDLLAREAVDVRAAEAVELFCHRAKKWIGSFVAALGGMDTLVFAGGIGENAPLIRKRIRTDEEVMIARLVTRALKLDSCRET